MGVEGGGWNEIFRIQGAKKELAIYLFPSLRPSSEQPTETTIHSSAGDSLPARCRVELFIKVSEFWNGRPP
jgi:hypothetical protein